MEPKPLELPRKGEFEFLDRERLALPNGKLHSRGRIENSPGMAPEVLGLAPWEVSSRRIAASASARMGTLIALESPRETGAFPQLLLDQRTSLDFGSTTQTISERIATLGLCLARVLVTKGPGCQVRSANESGFSRPVFLRSLSDWYHLYETLKTRELQDSHFTACEWIKPGLGQCVALFSDNKDPQSPIIQWLGSGIPPLGLLRIYDPWEENPPRCGNIRLIDSLGHIYAENWSDFRFRAEQKRNWQVREEAWRNLPQSLLEKLGHRTDAPWRDALKPWLKGQSNP